MHGQGAYFRSDGDRYEGEWRSNEKHGQGSFYYSFGVIFTGEMVNGKFTEGQLLIPSLSSSPFFAVFSGGDEIINDSRMYDVVLRTSEDGEIMKVCKFSGGQLIDK